MKHKSWIKALLLISTLISFPSLAQEYAPGLHQWKTKWGTVYVVSGLLTNGMTLYAHNYNFYFQREGEKAWYQIPLIDKGKPGDYELGVTAKAKEERMVRDARLEVRKRDIFLIYARSVREDDFDTSPITVTHYRLVATEGEDWPYFFERYSSKTHSGASNIEIDTLLKQEAKKIK